MAHQPDEPGVPNPAALLIDSELWRSVHLAAPPLSGTTLSPQQLAALAPAAGGTTATQFQNYLHFANEVSEVCGHVVDALEGDTQMEEDDRSWLRTRLEALSRRLQASVPRHGPADPAQAVAIRVAVERIGAKLRRDVEVHHAHPHRQATMHEFIILTLDRLHQQLHDEEVDEDFLWTEVVALLYIDIDMRAWYRFCRNGPWESLYYDDIVHHLKDMREDLARIQRRRAALLVHSELWRSVHLAAPPLAGTTLSPQQLAALAPVAGGTAATQLQTYRHFATEVSVVCRRAVAALRNDTQIAAGDRAWLRQRLEGLSRRLQTSVPPHGQANPAQADAVRNAVEQIGAKLRRDVAVHHAHPHRQATMHEFIILTLDRLHQQLHDEEVDEDFLWTEVVALLYIDIDMRAWYRFCRNDPWESLYYDDIVRHLEDMHDNLARIQRRRAAIGHQHSLSKAEFVPVARRNGMAF